MQFRIGHGYDVHRFADAQEADSYVTIGGVVIAHPQALLAHSDGDVLVHALCDALLGALALGDIGKHFPDSDPRYRNCSSLLLLQQVMLLVRGRGWELTNADMTLIAEQPRFAPHIVPMRTVLAATLGVAVDEISVKATTTEGLGFAGRREGVACEAVVLIRKGVA